MQSKRKKKHIHRLYLLMTLVVSKNMSTKNLFTGNSEAAFTVNGLSTKQRRTLITKEIISLNSYLPFEVDKSSQLRSLKAVCSYIKKEKHFQGVNNTIAKDSTMKSQKEILLNHYKRLLIDEVRIHFFLF